MNIDDKSLLVEVTADETLGALEHVLAAQQLTLGIDIGDGTQTVGAWLAAGAPSTLADPADHLVAGLIGHVGGRRLEVRPQPRRAVGPDLTALLLGAEGRFGTIERAWLRIHRSGARRPAMPLPTFALDPPVNEGEARLLEAISARLR